MHVLALYADGNLPHQLKMVDLNYWESLKFQEKLHASSQLYSVLPTWWLIDNFDIMKFVHSLKQWNNIQYFYIWFHLIKIVRRISKSWQHWHLAVTQSDNRVFAWILQKNWVSRSRRSGRPWSTCIYLIRNLFPLFLPEAFGLHIFASLGNFWGFCFLCNFPPTWFPGRPFFTQ